MSKTFRFQLTMELSAEICDSPLERIDEDSPEYLLLEVFQKFLKEFVKHPESVLEYYCNRLIDGMIKDENIDFEKIQRKLGYLPDHKKTFIDIAESCEPAVKSYITNLYDASGEDTTNLNNKEFSRDALEDNFRPLRVKSVGFDFKTPPDSENDEKS